MLFDWADKSRLVTESSFRKLDHSGSRLRESVIIMQEVLCCRKAKQINSKDWPISVKISIDWFKTLYFICLVPFLVQKTSKVQNQLKCLSNEMKNSFKSQTDRELQTWGQISRGPNQIVMSHDLHTFNMADRRENVTNGRPPHPPSFHEEGSLVLYVKRFNDRLIR